MACSVSLDVERDPDQPSGGFGGVGLLALGLLVASQMGEDREQN